MLKKMVTYTDYNDEEVTEAFYFNFTKLEIIEMVGVDDLEATVEQLKATEDNAEAYKLFKKILLSAYGRKAPDGKGFEKEDENGRPLSKKLEASPALGEIVVEFLNNPVKGGEFVEACLPAKLVAEAKEIQKAEDAKKSSENPSSEEITEMVQEAGVRQADPATAVAPASSPKAKQFEDYSRAELLAMSDDQFHTIVPRNPQKMSKEQMEIAYQRKS